MRNTSRKILSLLLAVVVIVSTCIIATGSVSAANTTTMVQGTIDKGTILSGVSTRIYTKDLLVIADYKKATIASGYKAWYHVYDTNGKWVGHSNKWVEGEYTAAQLKAISNSAVSFRVVVGTTSNANISTSAAALTLTASVVTPTMVQGTIDKGTILSNVATRIYTKDSLKIADYEKVTLASGYKAWYHVYDANGKWVAHSNKWVEGSYTAAQLKALSSNAVYFRAAVGTTSNANLSPSTLATGAIKLAVSDNASGSTGSSSSGGSSSSSSSSSSTSTTLDPNRTSLTVSASGAKGPETVKSTTPISTSEFKKPTFTKIKDSSTGLEYYYYKPSTAAPANGYPILLWLHGTNQSGDPFQSLNFWWSHNADILRNAVIIAPLWTGGMVQLSLDSYWGTSNKAVTLVKNIVSKSTYGKIDANRIYISGYSAGGMGTFREVAKNDGYFAAAVPLAGSAKSATMNDATLKSTPIWAWHGSKDTTVSYDANGSLLLGYASKAIYNKIGSSSKMRFTTVNGAVHGGAPYSASKDRRVWSWLFQQKKGSVQTRDYTVQGYIKVVDANGNTVMSELDCSGNPSYDSSTRTFTLTLTDAARTKLSNAYKSSGGKAFTVYYGNQKILTYTATSAVDSSMTKFVIKNAFSSSYSDADIMNRIGSGINVNKLSKTAYSETVT